jgi:hypothetical protein
MSFGAKEARETKIKADRKPRVNLCGDCGCEVHETELLCESCRRTGESLWEPIRDLSTLRAG